MSLQVFLLLTCSGSYLPQAESLRSLLFSQAAFACPLVWIPEGNKQLLNRCLPNLILFTFIWGVIVPIDGFRTVLVRS